jgi:acetyltransferase-like isoleucine patch superfamily enzyme
MGLQIFKKFYRFIIDKYLLCKIKAIPKLEVKGKIRVQGTPIIDIRNGANIIIGENCTLNSRNEGYHTALYSPVKLFADRKGAKILIGNNTRIHGSCIHAYNKIVIGNNCLIAANTNIFDGNGHDICFENVEDRLKTIGQSKPITIEDNVWIGINSTILPGVIIGEGSIVAANSVVTKNVPKMCIVAGNPAQIVKTKEEALELKETR